MKAPPPKRFSKLIAAILVLLSLTIISAIVASVVLYIYSRPESKPKDVKNAAIVTNGLECAALGKQIFQAGGNIADAAVTVVLCEGITCPQSSGVGGGFFLSYYSKKEGIVRTLNAREVAPGLADRDMYVNGSSSSVTGGMAVAVPGEIKGLWELHQRFGSMDWKDLIQPVIELCRNGHVVSQYLENVFGRSEARILNEPSLRDIFINPLTNHTYKVGEKIRRLKLAETLEVIAEKGVDAIYGGGEIGRMMVEDVRLNGGILTEEDLRNYEVQWSTSLSSKFSNNNTLHTFPLPSSGALLNFVFNILDHYDLPHSPLTYHRIIESFKFAYAKRSHLGDDNSTAVLEMMAQLMSQSFAGEIVTKINDTTTFNDVKHYGALYEDIDDQGTAHMSILAPNGDAIGVTNTINYLLGAFFRSTQTGIIMNNEMDDFSSPGAPNVYGIPPSPANFIEPGKRPMSSMIPAIVVDAAGDVRMVIGAAGGSRIPTGIFAAIFNHMYMNQSLADAIGARRLHHQLTPLELQWESEFDGEILRALNETFGHSLLENKPDGGFAAVAGIAVKNGVIEASFDPRRGGGVEVF